MHGFFLSHGITSAAHPPRGKKIQPLAHQNPLECCCSYFLSLFWTLFLSQKRCSVTGIPSNGTAISTGFLYTVHILPEIWCQMWPFPLWSSSFLRDKHMSSFHMIYHFFLMMFDALADMYILKYAIYVYDIWMVVVGITGDVHNTWTFIQLQNKQHYFQHLPISQTSFVNNIKSQRLGCWWILLQGTIYIYKYYIYIIK